MKTIRFGQGMGRCVVVLASVALMALPAGSAAQSSADGSVTFTRDVAPILQENCVVCHQEGSIGPMSLRTYEEAQRFAPLIRYKVASREMPPWPLDRTIGIQDFKNDQSLTEEEVETVVAWVDAGAPQGDPADMPPQADLPVFTETWQLASRFGPPDVTVTTEEYTVVANGLDQWFDSEVPLEGITEKRWIRAIEVRPSSPASAYVFHHGNSSLQQVSEDGEEMRTGIIGAAVGKMYDILPPDAGLPLYPGATVTSGIHYFPIGEEIPEATMDIGLYLYPEGEEPEFETDHTSTVHADNTREGSGGWQKISSVDAGGVRAVDIFIPPHGKQILRGTWVVQEPTRIHSIRGHMHLRGMYQMIEAVYPDGRHEVLNKLDWQHRWHTTFVYEDHAAPLLPKGTMVILTSIFDNTDANPGNPDPDQLVVFGRRSVDEMSHMWIGRTYFEQEDFDRLVREREEMLRERQIAQLEEEEE